jgi:hypothetical protein
MTKERAIALFDSKFWEDMSHEERARFQMNEERLCMPFDVFHEAVEKTLGRPVFTHEFAFPSLKEELLNGGPTPTFKQILELIPEEKRLVIVADLTDQEKEDLELFDDDLPLSEQV